MSLNIQNNGTMPQHQISFKSRGLSKLLSDPEQQKIFLNTITNISAKDKERFAKAEALRTPSSIKTAFINLIANLKNIFSK